jgi:ribose transport system ATP-binding protein
MNHHGGVHATAEPAVIAVRDLTMDFPGVRALDGVSLDLRQGEVHGLIGENGAGKSTLMKILAGLHQPTAGALSMAGEPVVLRGPADATARGVAMIHQELNLVSTLTVAENIVLGRERTRCGLIRRRESRGIAEAALARLGGGIDPALPVRRLAVAQQQIVEIARALACDARVLIMDEPTAVLSRKEAALLFDLIGQLKRDGVTVIYISHLLPEVLRVCDRITVLRDGQHVVTLDEAQSAKASEHQLAALMVGRPMANHFPPRGEPEPPVVLRVQDLCSDRSVREVSFTVRRGEILGFAGLIGAGRTELAEAIVGLRPRDRGSVLLDGEPVRIARLADAVQRGIVYLPEDRKEAGLVLEMDVVQNTTLAALGRLPGLLLNRRVEEAVTRRHVERLGTRVGRLSDPVSTLSGGNQQKIALAKWLELKPRVLIVDEPTRGVDIGAKEQIYRLLHELAARGMACVMISSEINELRGVCHRIAVMRRGRLVATLDGPAATEEQIMAHAAGVAPAADSDGQAPDPMEP